MFLSLLVLLAGAATGRCQEDEAADATSVAVDEQDPLAWVGSHEIVFIARVRAGGARLRSGPDPNYRVVREVPAGHLLVAVGDAPGHVAVLVPDGYIAYIHSRYVKVDETDVGSVTTSRVNVRSLPSSQGDYPIGQVHAGQQLWVWGKAGDDEQWLEITAPADLPLWAEDGDLEIAGTVKSDPNLLVELQTLRAERAAAWERRSEEAIARAEEQRLTEQAHTRIGEIRALVAEIRTRGVGADYAEARDQLTAVVASCADPAVGEAARLVEQEIVTLEELRHAERERADLLAELAAERKRQEQELDAALRAVREKAYGGELPNVGDEGDWHGFLRLRPDDGEHPIALEQGTRVMAWLDCSAGRVRLRDFSGQQVRVRGKVTRLDGAPTVDVLRLEIVRR